MSDAPRAEEESELHKLIRYGLDFEVARQGEEVAALRAENRRLRGQAKKARQNENRRKRRRLKRRRSGG